MEACASLPDLPQVLGEPGHRLFLLFSCFPRKPAACSCMNCSCRAALGPWHLYPGYQFATMLVGHSSPLWEAGSLVDRPSDCVGTLSVQGQGAVGSAHSVHFSWMQRSCCREELQGQLAVPPLRDASGQLPQPGARGLSSQIWAASGLALRSWRSFSGGGAALLCLASTTGQLFELRGPFRRLARRSGSSSPPDRQNLRRRARFSPLASCESGTRQFCPPCWRTSRVPAVVEA